MSGLRLERAGSPKGLNRLLFRAPIALFRTRLGFLLGRRFLMLEHTGRKTGELRRTVLEVVANHPDAVYVAAGWGERSHWLRNIRADSSVVFYLGAQRFETKAETVSEDDAAVVVSEYAAAHRRALDRLARFMLEDPGETPEEQVSGLASNVPLVRLPK